MQSSSRTTGFLVLLACVTVALVAWPEPAAPDPHVRSAVPLWPIPEGYWGSAEHGIAIVPPEGWIETRRQNRAYLDRVADSPLDGNFCVITIPNMLELDFDGLVEQNRVAFEQMPGLDLVTMDLLQLAGRDVVRTEFHATHQETGAEYHCLGLAFLRRGQQVVLTMTIAAEQWDEQREVAEVAIASVAFDPL